MTETLVGSRDVARSAGRPKKAGGEGKHVRLHPDLVAKAKIVALRRGTQVGVYLSGLLDTPVNRDYQRVLKELADQGRSE